MHAQSVKFYMVAERRSCSALPQAGDVDWWQARPRCQVSCLQCRRHLCILNCLCLGGGAG